MIAAALISLSLVTPAHDSWISANGFRSPANAWCCGDNDCFVSKGVKETSLPTVGYRLPDGEFVPLSETLPSMDGQFWRCQEPNGKRRCFFAPPGST